MSDAAGNGYNLAKTTAGCLENPNRLLTKHFDELTITPCVGATLVAMACSPQRQRKRNMSYRRKRPRYARNNLRISLWQLTFNLGACQAQGSPERRLYTALFRVLADV